MNCVVALGGSRFASGSDDGIVRIWDAATNGGPVATFDQVLGRVRALVVLPDGRLVSGCEDKTVRLLDVKTRACTKVLEFPRPVHSIAILDGDRLAVGCENIHIWSLSQTPRLRRFRGTPVVYSPSQSSQAACSQAGAAAVWCLCGTWACERS